MGLAELGACGAQAVPGGCLGTCDQPAIGDNSLDRGKPVESMDVIAPPKAAERAEAGHGVQPIQGGRVMVCGGVAHGAFDIATPRIVIADARASHCETLGHSRLSQALGDPIAVGVVGHLVADRRQMILAGGMVDVGQELGPLACPRPPAPEPGAGSPQGGRIARGLREHTTAQQCRNLL